MHVTVRRAASPDRGMDSWGQLRQLGGVGTHGTTAIDDSK